MEKADREKCKVDAVIQEINNAQHLTFSYIVKTITGLAVLIGGLYGVGIFKVSQLFVIGIAGLILLALMLENSERYIKDCYAWLEIALKENKILELKMPQTNPLSGLYYKYKYYKK